MKKKIISICITLFIFLSSTVGVFAVDLVADTHVPFWLLDIRNQCYLSNNVVDVTFGLATYGNDVSHYLVEIERGGALYLTYEVPAGETVYFRWAIARNNMGNFGWSTFVRMSVDGSQKVNHTYNYTNLGEYGTYGSIVIVEDYTNTSNSKQLVTYVITNDSTGDVPYEYVPILVGTEALINQGNTSFGDFDFTVDLTGVEDKLDDIIELLSSLPNEINFELPFELWQIYNYFINNYDYSFSPTEFGVPWLVRNSTQSNRYNDSVAFRAVGVNKFYFSFLTNHKDVYTPQLISRDGVVLNSQLYYSGLRGSGFGFLCTYVFEIDPTGYYTLFLPNYTTYDKFIPLYIGTGNDVPDFLSQYIGLKSVSQNFLESISSKFSDLIGFFNGSSVSSDNANIKNESLSNTVTEFDTIEKNQVENMQQNLNNLPTLDFNAFSDFAPTVQFVSSTMQQIYDSNQYLRLLINSCLLIGIALLLIGRGNRR